MTDVGTCSVSLLRPGLCCAAGCDTAAVSAVLDNQLVEHTRCRDHDHDLDVVGRKPLQWDPLWAPHE